MVVICPGGALDCASFARQHRLRMPVIVDENKSVSTMYQVQRTPSATLIDEDGWVRIHGLPNNLQHLEGLLLEEATPMPQSDWTAVGNDGKEVVETTRIS